MKRSPLLVIFITIFIDLVGFGIVIPLLPFYVESSKIHGSPRDVGLLFASYSVMQFIFAPILGRLSDKHGRRPVLLISIIGTGISFLILGFAKTLLMLFVGRILDGITGGNISTAQAYIADSTTKENRAKGMGLVGAAFGLGFVFGPAIGGVLSRGGHTGLPFFVAAGLAFSNAILLYFTLPETVTPNHPARVSAAGGRNWHDVMKALKQPKLGFVLMIYFLVIVAFSMMTTTFSLFTRFRFGYTAEGTGYLFAYVGIIGAFIQGGLLGRLVKQFGEMALILIGASLFALSLFLIPFTGPHTGLLALLAVGGAFAVGNSLATPSLTSLASKSVSEAQQGVVLGVTQSVASLARALGPAIQAVLIYSVVAAEGADLHPHNMSDHSIFTTFWTAAAIMFAAFLLAIYFARAYASRSSDRTVAAE